MAVTEVPDPPFNGDLGGDISLRALYPVENGVAAIVNDWSPDTADDDENATAGETMLISNANASRRAASMVPAQSGGILEGVLLYLFGAGGGDELGEARGLIPNTRGRLPDKVEVDAEDGSYAMLTTLGGELSLYKSENGVEWTEPPLTTTLTLPDGTTIEMRQMTFGEGAEQVRRYVMVWPPLEEGGEPRIFGMDGFVDDTGALEELDLESGEPKSWDDVEPPPLLDQEPNIYVSSGNLYVWKASINAGGDSGLSGTATFLGFALESD
jgi:hypothetical protein